MTLVLAKEILHRMLANFGIDGANREVYEAWDSKMGIFAKHAQVVSVKEDCVVINVDNSVFLQELILRKKEILDKFNKALGNRTFSEIKFKAGSIE